MVDRNAVIERVNSVFIESFEVEKEKLKPEMQILEDLGLDSLDIVDLVVALQKELRINIRNDEGVRSIRTLGDVYEFAVALLKEREA